MRLMKIREVLATIHYAESGRKEQELVHFFFTEDNEKYQLLKAYCVEYGYVIFYKPTNEILLKGY
jgi:hypothetical protein